MSRALLVLWLCTACRSKDDCERAVDRLHGAGVWGPGLAQTSSDLVNRCRAAGTPVRDPVLRCALDNDGDDAIVSCVERFTNSVLRGANGEAGSGINPLLER